MTMNSPNLPWSGLFQVVYPVVWVIFGVQAAAAAEEYACIVCAVWKQRFQFHLPIFERTHKWNLQNKLDQLHLPLADLGRFPWRNTAF
ncbi:MAG: hypothetical protein LUD78_01545 [Clostridiales bacterium]|nr:hypothetical protein [Clostridiales bacterium]